MDSHTEDPTTTTIAPAPTLSEAAPGAERAAGVAGTTTTAEARVRALIAARYAVELAAVGVPADELSDDLDLRAAGVIDSLGFLELVVALEEELGAELDFEMIDPDLLTTVGPLARHVAAQAAPAPQEA